MVDATNISIKRIATQGEMTLYEIKGTLTNGETLTIPTTQTEITTSSTVQIVSVNNVTDGTSAGTASASYTAASRLFTVTDAGASDDDVRILFYVS